MLWIGVAALLIALTLVPSARATFPGTAGPIVFASDRSGNSDIFKMDSSGGGVVQLTNSPASDSGPAVSPDGTKVAFVSNRDGDNEIFVMNIDGSGLTQLTTNTASDVDPAWHPDGNTLTFASDRDGDYEIYKDLPLDGSGTVAQVTTNTQEDRHPDWYSDGTRLVYQRVVSGNSALFVYLPDGGSNTNVTKDPSHFYGDASFKPDGINTILLTSDRGGDMDVYRAVLSGTSLTYTQLGANAAADSDPVFAPDSSRIAFVSDRDGTPGIFTMGTGGGSVVKLSSGSVTDLSPAWAVQPPSGPKASLSSTSHAFGNFDVADGPSVAFTATLSNPGTEDLTVGTLSLTGTDAGQFSIANDTCSDATLSPGESCSFDTAFDPSARGDFSASVSIPSNDADSPTSFAITGTGTDRTVDPISTVLTGLDSPAISCTVQTAAGKEGQRFCTASPSLAKSFDGTPIDIAIGLPPAPASGPDGNFPLVGMFHGWGGAKLGPNNGGPQSWLAKGYATFSMSDRGWAGTCGTPAVRSATPAWGSCDKGYIHMDDQRYEARDFQYFVGLLVDEGVINPDQVAVTGASYGGILSVQLAALNDRTRLEDGTLVPWQSAEGTPVHIAAAAPQALASDIAYALIPNGGNLDYVSNPSYFGPQANYRVGAQKEKVMGGFYGTTDTPTNRYYAPTGTDPSADVVSWYQSSSGPGPYDSGGALDAVNELTGYHSAAYVPDAGHPPAPMILSSGYSDDFVPVDESIRMYNRVRANHPDTPIAMFFGDLGHARSQDKSADAAEMKAQQENWIDHYTLGSSSSPPLAPGQVEAFGITCPSSAASLGPYKFDSYADMQRGEIRLDSTDSKTIAATGTLYGPQLSQPSATACTTVDATDNPATANYRTPPAGTGGYEIDGPATVQLKAVVTGPSDQIAARLVEVDPDTGQELMVERGIFRPAMDDGSNRQVFQLHPNLMKIEPGHVLKLELLPDDNPYSHLNATSPDQAAQHPIQVLDMQLRVPTRDAPGAADGQVLAPSPKFLPEGYEIAEGFTAEDTTPPDDTPPETTIDAGPTGTISVDSATFEFSSSEPGSTFECRLDSGDWAACTSPETLGDLSEGAHTFEVRATDEAGNTDQSPASRTFTVDLPEPPDTTPPETTISAGPSGTIEVDRATFEFSSSEPGSTFECRLDAGGWAACVSPKVLTGLAEGQHSFEVRATDAAGNTDASPAGRAFTVKLPVTINPPPPRPQTKRGKNVKTKYVIHRGKAKAKITLRFSSDQPDATFQCRKQTGRKKGKWHSCRSPYRLKLRPGVHLVRVRARTAAGADSTPLVFKVKVKRKRH
ncbi:MAG: hypothetical protein BGO23_02050 [Solirubrobacterales bacterium 67-14]|nr:MAG: hypothetical protein BGO23_02050 [Solirubrobacterales bacterium 67-14]